MNLMAALRGSIRPQKELVQVFTGDYSFDRSKARASITGAEKPILQLNTFPMTIDPSDFANPFGPTNPGGSYTTLYSFYQLVDPVPSFAKNYWPTNNSTDITYGNLLSLATADPAAPAITILSNAKKKYEISKLTDMAGTGINFHATYAVPYSWYGLSSNYLELEIDLTDPGALEECGFTVLGGDDVEAMKWKIGNLSDPGSQKVFGTNTTIERIKFKYSMVAIQRPWLDFQIFSIPGWKIKGLSRAYYSTGTLTNNNGLLPVLPTGMIIGRDIQITARWSDADRQMLKKAEEGSQAVSLGQFALSGCISGCSGGMFTPKLDNNTISLPALHVVGWVSSLVPLSPQED